ncbi:uncharacterized oxidoreductase YjmC isoform X3 [Cherax quadricarinatus]|uniref:uncharacterized oxidoreductase YjmC isoform X3 n=1 Tax=Cherax quadricarinatus TaxID=27406 RepID=UPI00237938DC|nr:uncharacterized oxidoreductase YjmC-like isoform X3 [Cherax quadricarinatus]
MASASEKSDNFTPNNLGIKYREEEVERFMVECMMTQGVSRDRATTLAQVLVAADVRGHYSHGLHRLGHYINDVKNNLCDAGTTPTIVKESVSTALVDGNNGLGPVVGKFAMDLAIRKAQTTGIGWVCAKGSNHYGIAGWYTMRAAKQGLVGVSFTNTHPVVVPTRGKQGALGTNPISVAAPAEGDDSFVLDMSTSVVAYGKVEVAHTKNEAIPEGWAVDKHGCMTTSSAECLDGGFIMPLGGPELHSGYKGFGLSMMVEIFCGIMSEGSHFSRVPPHHGRQSQVESHKMTLLAWPDQPQHSTMSGAASPRRLRLPESDREPRRPDDDHVPRAAGVEYIVP